MPVVCCAVSLIPLRRLRIVETLIDHYGLVVVVVNVSSADICNEKDGLGRHFVGKWGRMWWLWSKKMSVVDGDGQ